ncbi:hypothetical protein M427DRAFT_39096 [Gonapodya prolifera JEL478]|uniref:SnoaL-like domain-containing protein n=1 Tax=Gonapodya prolifera (strain JEL478) TaxID=1344416 RepID=A0A138ZY52_GONPJ|nr:hypothetical protein M427DRAFT_39096 [Gonapodya prolifera JEL478]|eukprot:KXS09391.1 hypothetical protein M427DRAFT_39096 [Gonapodya prolifera JEL478]
MSTDSILALASRLVTAIERGDIPTMRECYAPDAKICPIYQTVDEQIATFQAMLRTTSSLTYTDRVVTIFQGPGAKEVTVTGLGVNFSSPPSDVASSSQLAGPTLHLPTCVICTLNADGSRVTELREYMDQTTVDKYLAQAAAVRWRVGKEKTDIAEKPMF